jgi:hypothetical protein
MRPSRSTLAARNWWELPPVSGGAEHTFFAQADLVDLPPLSLAHVHDMIESAFHAVGDWVARRFA